MSYDTVFEAASALLRGQVLRGVEDEAGAGEGAWGVIACRDALGAFDARSEAWGGRDGIPHRYTSREEAELRARRLTVRSLSNQHEPEK